MKRWIPFAMLASSAVLLTSCARIFGRPEQGITVQEKVSVCFRQSQEAHFIASIEPTECYSIRCTQVVHESGTAIVDQRAYSLKLQSRFVLRETSSFLIRCSSDCAGGGRLDFDLEQLEVGLYDVLLWDEPIGKLSVTSGLPWQDQCLVVGGED